MDGPFDSAWLKWGRGVVHTRTLENELRQYESKPYGKKLMVGFRPYDPKRHGFPAEIAETVAWPEHWGPLLGDIVANLRSALDHCAWAIVHRGHGGGRGLPLTKEEANNVYFPIVHTDNRQFNRDVTRKLIGARRADIAVVRKAQPYHRRTRYDRHAFYVLNELAKRDKHRTIQPVHMVITKGNYTFTEMRDCVPSTDKRRPRWRHVKMEKGAELGVVRVRKTGPNPYAQMKSAFEVSPGITERLRFDQWLNKTVELIRMVLLHLGAEPPDKIVELGDPTWFFHPSDLPPHLRPRPAHEGPPESGPASGPIQ